MKKIAIYTITLLMLVGIAMTSVNKADAAKQAQKQTIKKESVKLDNNREINDDDDCDKCEQKSKTEKISKEDREESCQKEDEDSDQEKNDDDKKEHSDRD